MSWPLVVAVACGGALGSVGRYLTSILMGKMFGIGFPWGTVTVNIIGAFLMGALVEFVALRYSISQELRAFLAVGVLGGFTTFSSFALDTAVLFERGQLGLTFAYFAGTLVAGISAMFFAIYLVRQIIAG